MATTETSDELRFFTPEFTGSFVYLIDPKKQEHDDGSKKDPKFCITIPLDHGDAFWEKLDTYIEKAALKKFNGKVPKKLVTTRHDGDDMDLDKFPEFEGKFLIEAGNDKRRPEVLIRDSDGSIGEVVNPADIYAGARYVATVRTGGWYHPPSKKQGVSLYLENVLKVRDGERLGGSTPSAMDDFGNYEPESETVGRPDPLS